MTMTWGEELNKQHALYRLEREWREVCKAVFVRYGPNTDSKIPKFAQKFSKHLFDQEKELRPALMRGDMPWFTSWFMRLDMIEKALTDAGYDEERREPIVRARWMLQRLSLLAHHRLVAIGGTWPPSGAS